MDNSLGQSVLGSGASLFLAEVCTGLALSQKTLPCKYFYDDRGSRLFDAITQTPEYYLGRMEREILTRSGPALRDLVGPQALLVELGPGDGSKGQLLLQALEHPAGYLGVDIAADALRRCQQRVARAWETVPVSSLLADYTLPWALPRTLNPHQRCLLAFLGSSIGNFEPAGVVAFLRQTARVLRPHDIILIGVDLAKDPAVLEAAYNDQAGLTAAFNLHLLERINRELGADFDLTAFRHRAIYRPDRGRVEMHLESLAQQWVRIGTERFRLERGETIHTENSYKFQSGDFQELLRAAGLTPVAAWTDHRGWFSLQVASRIPVAGQP